MVGITVQNGNIFKTEVGSSNEYIPHGAAYS